MVSANNSINNTVGASISGVTNTLTVTNPSNTASSQATANITVGGGTAGDTWTQHTISGTRSYAYGIDNSDSDSLKINTAAGSAVDPSSGTNLWKMDSSGRRIMPLQPAFWAGAGGAQTNVTGDGTSYTIIFSSEQFDQGNNFDGTSTFTAPVTGKYFFYATTTLLGITAAHTFGSLVFWVNGVSSQAINYGNVAAVNSGGIYTLQMSGFFNLTVADTIVVQVRVAGGAKTISLFNSTVETKFTGYLVC